MNMRLPTFQKRSQWLGLQDIILGKAAFCYHRYVDFIFIIKRIFGEHFPSMPLCRVLKAKRNPAKRMWGKCLDGGRVV